MVLLHAGSVSTQLHGGLLLLGKGGAGKSTATIKAMELGLQSCGDDYVFVSVNPQVMHTLYRTVKFKSSGAIKTPGYLENVEHEFNPDTGKEIYFLEKDGGLLIESSPLRNLMLLDQNQFCFKQLKANTQSLIQLCFSTIAQIPVAADKTMCLLNRLIDRCEVWNYGVGQGEEMLMGSLDLVKQRETLSVVVPVYNGAAYVEEAIASIMQQQQEIFDIEIITVNDGSIDETQKVLDQLSTQHSNLSVVHLATNQGAAASRNAGVEAATGKWLTFLDHDDCWQPNKLDEQYTFLKNNPQYDFVLAHQLIQVAPGKSRPVWAKPDWLNSRQAGNVFGTMLIKRKTFLKVGLLKPEITQGGEDVEWFIQAKQAGLVRFMMEPILLHRKIHDTNLSRLTYGANNALLTMMRNKIAAEKDYA